MKFKKGDRVKIRIKRMEGGCSHKRGDESMPLVTCVINQVDVCGVEGCYGCKFEDTDEPVGLPFFEGSFEEVLPS